MNKNITISEVKGEEIEICRNLCNELMKFQQSKATIAPECFDLMNFDTRMKPSYKNANFSQVLVAKDNDIPIGYIFSTVDTIKEKMTVFPAWAPNREKKGIKGFYPDWIEYPITVGCISNFYIKEEYRGTGLALELLNQALYWLKSFKDIKIIFAYISNGNNKALDFYLKNGFIYSHEVFDGFIKTTYYPIK